MRRRMLFSRSRTLQIASTPATVTAEIDWEGRVDESNEGNNTAEAEIAVNPVPDIVTIKYIGTNTPVKQFPFHQMCYRRFT